MSLTLHRLRLAPLPVWALLASLTALSACGSSSPADSAVPPTDSLDASPADGAGFGTACTSDEGCRALLTDVGACRAAACIDGACGLVTSGEGTACQPSDKCLVGGLCQAGECAGGAPRRCADDNPCTTEQCDSAVGCVQEAVSAPCDDGDACTVGDACSEGQCIAGAPMDCDDDNLCTTQDRCVDGQCVADAAGSCDDSNGCTTEDVCHPATGYCLGTPTAACACSVDADCLQFDDTNPCNGGLVCAAGQCTADPTTVVSCAPTAAPSPCLAAACDPQTGQCGELPVADGSPCSDGDPCTLADTCTAGVCAPGAPKHCDDSNPCTDDLCQAVGDCTFTFSDACACTGAVCAPTGSPGDSLPLLFSAGSPVETVGLAVFDGYAITCGGFGLDVYRIGLEPAGLIHSSAALPRCQNIEKGPLVGGQRILWATNHGDAYVKVPSLTTMSLDLGSGGLTVVDTASFTSAESAEGMHFDSELGVLWVAFHAQGLTRYTVGPQGGLTPMDSLGGLNNAWRLARSGGFIYVADGQAGLKVLDRLTGAVVGAASTPGFAKDIEVVGTMALLATSTMGVHAFDVSDPTSPVELSLVFTDGSALQVASMADGTRLAVANTSDVVVMDTSHPSALKILAVDRGTTKANQPRILAVGADGDLVISGEWLGIGLLQWRDGLVGPEFHVDRSAIRVGGIAPGQQHAEKLLVKNRGFVDLEVSAINVANPAIWSVSPPNLTLAPGAQATVTVIFAPDAKGTFADALSFQTNDPDEATVSVSLVGNPPVGPKADVGSPLGQAFDFLDVDNPLEEQSIENLRGNVLVLAYFATF